LRAARRALSQLNVIPGKEGRMRNQASCISRIGTYVPFVDSRIDRDAVCDRLDGLLARYLGVGSTLVAMVMITVI
jgi:hypothetical protein